MPLSDYATLLRSGDALIMNCIRPQGFGNIFIMMMSDKPVFFNNRNYSLQDLRDFGITCYTLEDVPKWFNENVRVPASKDSLINLLSQDRIDVVYKEMFGG